MLLRPYQQRLVTRAKKALVAHGNTLAVAPTGAGKTIMLSALAGAMDPKKALVLQHREELVTQNLSKFGKVNPGVPVSLYTAGTKSWRGKVTFGMVQTLSRPANLKTIPPLDLLIIDEAHHVAAASYRNIIDAARSVNPSVRIAGFTATPGRGDKKALRSVFDNVADHISLKELIERGFLVTPRAYVVDVSGVREGLSHVRKLHNDFDMAQVEQVMNKTIVNAEVVKQWREKAGDRKTIVFCSTVQHALDVCSTFQGAGISTEMITGESTPTERAGMIRRLKSGQTQVVVNVAVLTEGFDEPSVACVVLLRPCSAKSTMIQMIGRGLRTLDPELYPGQIKKDCIVLDFGTSILTHGNLTALASLGKEEDPNADKEASAAPYKNCPEKESDRNGQTGCGAKLPIAVRTCPLCGFDFTQPESAEEAEEVVLTEIDLLNSSPFRWVDLFGSGKVMLASGFEAWAGVMSPDGENWYALGQNKPSRIIHKLMIGERMQALAAADDFLREHETSGSASKSKRWLRDVASDRQKELLNQLGYGIGNTDYSFTKYSAASHLNFQWNRKAIEAAMFGVVR